MKTVSRLRFFGLKPAEIGSIIAVITKSEGSAGRVCRRARISVMAIEKVRAYFEPLGFADRIREFEVSSATVELAAQALGCEGKRIAKTLSFDLNGETLLIVAAGDARVDNGAYKARFGGKAKMLAFEEVEARTGHAVGGVCPFAVNEGVRVYLDESLRRFETVFPACGSSNSAIELTLEELERLSGALGRVDVCKGWRDE